MTDSGLDAESSTKSDALIGRKQSAAQGSIVGKILVCGFFGAAHDNRGL